MTGIVRVKAALVPWDDQEFVLAYERAHAEVETAGPSPEGIEAAGRVQALLRARGYPLARVEVARTVDEALRHVAHWTIRRDG